jgi:hypothetical protein
MAGCGILTVPAAFPRFPNSRPVWSRLKRLFGGLLSGAGRLDNDAFAHDGIDGLSVYGRMLQPKFEIVVWRYWRSQRPPWGHSDFGRYTQGQEASPMGCRVPRLTTAFCPGSQYYLFAFLVVLPPCQRNAGARAMVRARKFATHRSACPLGYRLALFTENESGGSQANECVRCQRVNQTPGRTSGERASPSDAPPGSFARPLTSSDIAPEIREWPISIFAATQRTSINCRDRSFQTGPPWS